MDQLLLLFVPAVANLVLVKDVVLLVIDLIEGETGQAVDADILVEVPVVDAVAFSPEFCTVAHGVLQAVVVGDVCRRELQDGVLHPGGVHTEVPYEVAFLDDVEVHADLDAAVAH